MILLLIFAFIAGLVTILSPCILPVLPVVLSGTVGGRRRPYGIVLGFVASFTFFTLFLSGLVKATGLSADALRVFSIAVIFTFGIALLVPKFQVGLERLFGRLAALTPNGVDKHGFWGGVFIGLSLGLIWTPCVGPILASVIALVLAGTVGLQAALITFAYALGTAIPMLAVAVGGRQLLDKVPYLTHNTVRIQQAFGGLMILTAIAIATGFDRQLQVYVLDKFPNWGVGLTRLEDREDVKKELQGINGQPIREEDMGKPSFMLLDDLGTAPELIPGGEWLNSAPLKLNELRGKVVLIDFWTYSCINCIRTLPYLRTWNDLYAKEGLVIIGVHTPEFEFEKNVTNVKNAVADFKIKYPVVQDNNFQTWNAYNNHYWPAKYLIDKDGRIRYTHFGEGAYDETEQAIQTLLTETGKTIAVKIDNPQYQVQARTPELYLGQARVTALASPQAIVIDKPLQFTVPASLGANKFAYGGIWTIGLERAIPDPDSALVLNFDAKDVYLVMRPKTLGLRGQIRVTLDDQLVTTGAGADVKTGFVTVNEDRLYHLIELDSAGKHQLKLEFLNDNVELFAFTFG